MRLKDSGEVAELQSLAGHALARLFRNAPAYAARLAPDVSLIFSGEPNIDLNALLVGPCRDCEPLFREAGALGAAAGVSFAATVVPHAHGAMDAAERAGLQYVGATPLMMMRPGGTIAPGPACEVRRVETLEERSESGDLVASAFNLERRAVARTLDLGLNAAAGVERFIARGSSGSRSTVTVTRTGRTAGIWCMATPAQDQGRGCGSGLLTRVMEDLRQAGVERFYLYATAAGAVLYRKLGFNTLAECPSFASPPLPVGAGVDRSAASGLG